MMSLKTILLIILSIHLFAIIVLKLSYSTTKFTESKLDPAEIEDELGSYEFHDPSKALYLLNQLDIFSTVENYDNFNYSSVANGFIPNNNYCSDHRVYFVRHPEMVFESKNFITNYWKRHKLRSQVISSIGGKDLHPKVYYKQNLEPQNQFKHKMKLNANIFFTYNLFFKKRQVGKQFSCLSQASNHIPGHDKIYRKDGVGQALADYAKKYESRPKCFDFNKYFPKTWVLQQKDRCLDFFKEFTSLNYKRLKEERHVVYFRKIGADMHEGKGVFLVNDEEEHYIKNLYKNGTLCGKIDDNNLIQYNIHNLLLVENHKFGLRIFLLIASTNPVIAYYHDGYARLSLNEYDPTSKEVITFVTNIGINIKEAEKDIGITQEQIQESTFWLLEDFQSYLIHKGKITDSNWLDHYLRPELKRVMIHLVRMAQSGFYKTSSVFELYGLDFVMDEQLQIWFIEANAMPLVSGSTEKSVKLFNKMLADTFEIVLGLIRSRMKRVVRYINSLCREVDDLVQDLEGRRREFQEVSKNSFELEFLPSIENTFELIIDETKFGIQKYAGFIEPECL